MSTTQPFAVAPKAGPLFWRFLAFDIDCVLLFLIVRVADIALFDVFSDLGGYGRFVGAGLVALYFGYFESEQGGGRSPGKRFLGLKVVSVTGDPVSPPRAAARALIVTAPILISGVPAPGAIATALVNLVVVGLEAALIYLAIFNRPSRRSIHDLATATAVTNARDRAPAPLPLGMAHIATIVVLALLAVAGPPLAQRLIAPAIPRYDTSAIAARVAATAGIASVAINVSRRWSSQDPRWRAEVEVAAKLRHWPDDRSQTAKAALAAIASGDEKLLSEATVTLVLWSGYDLGIVDREVSERFALQAKPGA